MDRAPGDLLSTLENLRCKNAQRRWFIPERRLHESLTKDVIQAAMQAASVELYKVPELAEHILQRGVKIFAVLVLIGSTSTITKFAEKHEYHDSRLPFVVEFLQTVLSPAAARRFEERQWEVMAPQFNRGTIHRLLDDDIVLPFMKEEDLGEGSFGAVFKIELNHDHQNFENIFQGKLVRKEFKHEFERLGIDNHRVELENLARLSHLRHPNIIELLASYSYRGKQNLIFPLAEGGTLSDLLACIRQATLFTSDGDVLVAVAGLSSAIEHVHNFIEKNLNLELMGCHYDLRTKNILLSGKSFLLADFGLSRFKETTDSSGTLYKAGGGNYCAPECEDIDDTKYLKRTIRRSSDIWSFGCMLADLITYMIHDSTGVERFKQMRRFQAHGWHYLFHRGPGKSNGAVDEWLAQLEKDSPKFSEIVELIRQMLTIDEARRPKAQEVTARLRLIALREKANSVDTLLDELCTKPFFDAQLEYAKFQSWRYALGIQQRAGSPEVAEDAGKWHIATYRDMLEIIDDMQSVSRDMCCKPDDGTIPTFYPLSDLNQRLHEFLSERSQEKYRLYLDAFVLWDTDFTAIPHEHDRPSNALLPAKIRMRAALKHMTNIAMEHWGRQICTRRIDVTSVKILSAFGDHHVGLLQQDDTNQHVLVEWRRYAHWSADDTVNQELFVRSDAIAGLMSQEKPEEFRALDCRGFFHDLNRSAFGVVYDLPQGVLLSGKTQSPTSLYDLLEQTWGDVRRQPALEDKLRVAAIISRSVSEFHSVDWLHKSLFSSNVAFFPTSKLVQDNWFQSPYIVGFNHSRPDEVSAITVGPTSGDGHYQHPMYIESKRRYCREYEYYSLGVILLEIGFWRPLCEIVRKFEGSREQVRQKLIETRLPTLKQYMGRHYHEAVRVCLESDFQKLEYDRDHNSDAASLHLEFNRKVVHPLERILEGF